MSGAELFMASPHQSSSSVFRRAALRMGVASVLLFLLSWAIRPKTGWEVETSWPGHPENFSPQYGLRDPPVNVPTESQTYSGHEPAIYSGKLRIAYPGMYFFYAGAKLQSRLWIDGRPVAGQMSGPEFPWRGMVELDSGLHDLRFEVIAQPGRAINLRWSKEVDASRPIPRSVAFPPGTAEWRFSVSAWLRFLALAALGALASFLLVLIFKPKSPARFYFRIVALGLGVLFFVAFAEVALRVVGFKPREYVPGNIWLNYKLDTPGATTRYVGYLVYNVKEFETEVTINSKGWRDKEYPYEKPAGTYRIVILGDSYVEGKEVALEKTFHKLLEARLNAHPPAPGMIYEVIALARGGTGTYFEIVTLKEAMKYSPDLVIASLFPGNDIRENNPALNEAYEKWLKEVYIDRIVRARIAFLDRALVLRRSALNQFLAARLCDLYIANLPRFEKGLTKAMMTPLDLGLYARGDYAPEWQEAWRITEAQMKELKGAAEAAGVKFGVMIPYSVQVPGMEPDRLSDASSPYDLLKPWRLADDLCQRLGVDRINMQPVFDEFQKRERKRTSWRFDSHWNEDGHALAEKTLHEFIRPKLEARDE